MWFGAKLQIKSAVSVKAIARQAVPEPKAIWPVTTVFRPHVDFTSGSAAIFWKNLEA